MTPRNRRCRRFRVGRRVPLVIEREFRASNARLKRIEHILIGSCAFIIGLLITLVVKL